MRESAGTVRVLIVHDTTDFGGLEVVILRVAEHIDRDRFELALAVPDTTDPHRSSPQELIDRAGALGLAVHRLPAASGGPFGLVNEIVATARQLRRLQPDIIHIHTARVGGAKKTPLAAALARVPVVIRTEHSSPRAFDDGTFGGRLRILADRLTERVYTVSNHDRDAQIADVGRPAELVETLTNGVDCTFFAPDAVSPVPWARSAQRPEFVIGSVGRLEDVKRPQDLVSAHHLLRQRGHDVDLLLVGGGSLESELRHQVETLGTTAHVHFAGTVDDPRPYFAQLDIGVMTSRYEGFALAVLEMMAMALPTVVTDHPGLTEAVVENETSLVADIFDTEQIADAVEQLLLDGDMRERFASAGRTHVTTNHSLETYVRTQEAHYIALLDR